ncbi:hypothetical protein [Allorhodopirellula solitaria]|uniref:DUF4878 domain-containing protein n=1 Tax=Allorhodopirellula solitaria TaxID=2527987 RepID=A0A5C5YD37_9BACT|nr:hypothetical protein [Allorhodopirellula solitaria]TWT73004.1 hypothetical protein CA85_14650 [Allorhodopirellula solitaria]
MKIKFVSALLTLLCISSTVGCGSSAVKPTDEQNAFASVEGLGDIAGDQQMFANAFVPGSVPEDRAEYGKRGYQVSGEATYDGDQVTVPVKIFGGVHETAGRDGGRSKPSKAGETEQVWTLQRIDGQWKLKDAPLG